MEDHHFGGYILKDHTPVKCDDPTEWARWMGEGNRRVAETVIEGVRISTVFLGLDHAFGWMEDSPPILFEPMIFGGPHDQYQERCSTWEEAEEMHKVAVTKVKR